MSDERISCPKCNKKSVPRLWRRGSVFTKKKTDHLCPFCGATMYTTGGGLSAISVLLLLIIGSPLIMGGLSVLIPKNGHQTPMPTSKIYQITEKDLHFAQKIVNKYNIEIDAVEESIKKGSTPYILERAQMYRDHKKKYQMVIDQYYEERKQYKAG